MKYCETCGKTIPDTAQFCDGCGSPVKQEEAAAQPSPPQTAPSPAGQAQPAAAAPAKGLQKKKRLLCVLIPLGALLLLTGMFFLKTLPTRDVTFKDLKNMNTVKAVLTFGLPESKGEDYIRFNRATFCGVKPLAGIIVYDPEEQEISFFTADGEKLYDALEKYCKFDKAGYSYIYYTYHGMRITVGDDLDYCSIELDP